MCEDQHNGCHPSVPPKRTPIFQIDAFTTRRFAGNPAAVMPMTDFPADEMMQAIAAENNLAEFAGWSAIASNWRVSACSTLKVRWKDDDVLGFVPLRQVFGRTYEAATPPA